MGISDHEFGVNGVFTRGACCVVVSQLLEQNILKSPLVSSTPNSEEVPDSVEIPEQTQIPDVKPTETTSTLVILPADSNKDGILSTEELNEVFDRFRLEYPQGTR